MSKAKQKSAVLDERQAAKYLGISQSWLRASRSKHPAWAGPSLHKKRWMADSLRDEGSNCIPKTVHPEDQKIDPADRMRSAQGKSGSK